MHFAVYGVGAHAPHPLYALYWKLRVCMVGTITETSMSSAQSLNRRCEDEGRLKLDVLRGLFILENSVLGKKDAEALGRVAT